MDDFNMFYIYYSKKCQECLLLQEQTKSFEQKNTQLPENMRL